MNSLERRLQIGLSISLVGLMLLLGWLLYSTTRQMTDSFVISRLEHDGESLLAAIQFDDNGNPVLNESRIGGIYHQPLSGHYYAVVAPASDPLFSRSLWDAQLAVATLSPGNKHHWKVAGPANQSLLVWAGGYLKQGKAITVAVAEDLSPLHQQLKNYGLLFGVLVLGVITGLMLLQRRIVRRSFLSLDQVREEIHRLEEGVIG